MSLDSGLAHLLLLEPSGWIITDFADISRRQSPARAGRDGRGHLATGQNLRLAEFNLGIERREMRQANDGVGSVQPHANDIDAGSRFEHKDTLRKIDVGASEKEAGSVSDNFSDVDPWLTYYFWPCKVLIWRRLPQSGVREALAPQRAQQQWGASRGRCGAIFSGRRSGRWQGEKVFGSWENGD
jgi:hypothetical protein